jgi:alpha-glucosidase (family GH31 glycosyl hydrolase)
MKDMYKLKTTPVCNKAAEVKGDCYRFTVLTPRLIRMEYSKNGEFEDRATQTVINRCFDVPKYSVSDADGVLKIRTECIEIEYTKGEFTKDSLSAKFIGEFAGRGYSWCYGEVGANLKGTARTLDGVNGECELSDGLMNRFGMYALSDSKTLAINEDGWVEPRDTSKIDVYLFAYCRDYLECLKDFYKLTGKTPLVPRYALGNWWSRYYPYSQEEYIGLMDEFRSRNIPFSVAIIDMDWHKVKIDPKYGSGWTGFSWNKKLFPSPEEFLSSLHKRNLKTALNLHPAEGVAAHEDSYLDIAKEMGVDYENEERVEFDISDPKFVEAYFKYLLYPHEKIGVDFWWMDWQQGTKSKIEGLDPLWMLNHFHFLDNAKNGNRPLAFSRYAGVGSHRYPIGFSGDTVVTWESLDFQPYFTATASNVGYGWWSHDIGGHMQGIHDDELTARWVQLGVFSPIMRLHSSNGPFLGKEPWNYDAACEKSMIKFLRLRHALIPYLYSMNYEASYNDSPLVQPLYYKNPDTNEAYNYKNEYYFGTQMIAAPITQKSDEATCMGSVNVWLPEGEWYDFFNMFSYKGNRIYKMYRNLYEMPVFVKAGGIIPMAENSGDINDISNPEKLTVAVYPGADNSFDMYEDDNNNCGKYAVTTFKLKWSNKPEFEIINQNGKNPYAPEKRTYKIEFRKISDASIKAISGDKEIPFKKVYENNTLIVILENISKDVKVIFESDTGILKNNRNDLLYDRMLKMQMENNTKIAIYNYISNTDDVDGIYQYLETVETEDDVKSAVREILSLS